MNHPINGIYHYLMSLEEIHRRDEQCPSILPPLPGYNDNYLEYVFMITTVLDKNPEYSWFWRYLGNIYRHLYAMNEGDSYHITACQCYRRSVMLGNLSSINSWIGLYKPYCDIEFTSEIIEKLQYAGSQGNAFALRTLSRIYRNGHCGISRNLEQAAKYELLT